MVLFIVFYAMINISFKIIQDWFLKIIYLVYKKGKKKKKHTLPKITLLKVRNT